MGNVEQCSSGSGVGLEQLSAATGGPDEGHEPVPALRGLAAGVASGAGRPGWRHHRPPVRHDVRLPPRSRGASPQVSKNPPPLILTTPHLTFLLAASWGGWTYSIPCSSFARPWFGSPTSGPPPGLSSPSSLQSHFCVKNKEYFFSFSGSRWNGSN